MHDADGLGATNLVDGVRSWVGPVVSLVVWKKYYPARGWPSRSKGRPSPVVATFRLRFGCVGSDAQAKALRLRGWHGRLPSAGRPTRRSASRVIRSRAGVGRSTRGQRPQHCLYFLPLPQGQGSVRPTLGPVRVGLALERASLASLTMSLALAFAGGSAP